MKVMADGNATSGRIRAKIAQRKSKVESMLIEIESLEKQLAEVEMNELVAYMKTTEISPAELLQSFKDNRPKAKRGRKPKQGQETDVSSSGSPSESAPSTLNSYQTTEPAAAAHSSSNKTTGPAAPATSYGDNYKRSEPAAPAPAYGDNYKRSEPAAPATSYGDNYKTSEPAAPASAYGSYENSQLTGAKNQSYAVQQQQR